MHGVGFEPTSIATPHLECGPLDRSGIRASPMYSLSFLSNNTNLITLIIYFIQDNPFFHFFFWEKEGRLFWDWWLGSMSFEKGQS